MKGRNILGSPASQVNVLKPATPGNIVDVPPKLRRNTFKDNPNKAEQICKESTPLSPKPVSDNDDIPTEPKGNERVGDKSGRSDLRSESSEEEHEGSNDVSEAKEMISTLSDKRKLEDQYSKSLATQKCDYTQEKLILQSDFPRSSVDDSTLYINRADRPSFQKDDVPDSSKVDTSTIEGTEEKFKYPDWMDVNYSSGDDSASTVHINGVDRPSFQKEDVPDSSKAETSTSEGTTRLEDAARRRLSFRTTGDGNKPKRKKHLNSVIIPDDVVDMQETEIVEIEQSLQKIHECFNEFRIRGEGSRFPFPKGVQFSMSIDMKFLQKMVNECTSDSDLYGNYAIIDVFTQWGFLGKPEEKFALHLPAGVYEMMKKKNNFEQTLELCKSTSDWDNVFDYKVITLFVWHGSHFSIAFIVNAGILYDQFKKRRRHTTTSDPAAPCILYANSLESGGAHHKESVSKNIRFFFNKLLGFRVFHVASMPAYDIKTAYQNDGFSCAYHSILARHAVLKSLRKHVITQSDINGSFAKRDFSYDERDVHKVRAGIAELVAAIHSIKKSSCPPNFSALSSERSDEETRDGPYFRERERLKIEAKAEEKERKAEEKRKKKEMKESVVRTVYHCKMNNDLTIKKKVSIKEMRNVQNKITVAAKKRREDARRLAQWESRMGPELDPEERKARLKCTKRYVERRSGARCTNIKHYKDRTYRRTMNKLSTTATEMGELCRYSTQSNAHMPRTEIVTIVHDMVGERPHDSSEGNPLIRDKKLRMAIGGVTKEEFKALLEDALNNIEHYVFTDDAHEVDTLLMGPDRMDLDEFLRRVNKRDGRIELQDDRAKSSDGPRDRFNQSAKKELAHDYVIEEHYDF